jgi:hypothetical protein
MIKFSYDWEIITMTNMLLNSMSDIVIKRFNVHKEARDRIKTRILYAPKQRVLADLLDKDQNLQLPVMSVYIGGITRDTTRVYNKILGTFQSATGATTSLNEKSPLPVDIAYNVSIMTRYQEDMDQILSHLLPYINPYFVVSWRTPLRPEFEIRSSVYWNGNVNIVYPNDINATQVARVVADLSFTFKGWMFQSKPEEGIGNIHTVHSTYVDNSRNIRPEFLLETDLRESTDVSDYIRYDGVPPQPKYVDPYFTRIGESQTFTTFGPGFTVINNIYLSGGPVSHLSTTYNPFGNSPELSANNPPFTAVKLLTSDWSYDRDTFASFTSPPPQCPGRMDLIIEGPVGYGKLTEFTRVNTFNPYLTGTAKHDNFVPYQFPFLSGIEVRMENGTQFNYPSLSGVVLLESDFDLLQEDDTDLILEQRINNCNI